VKVANCAVCAGVQTCRSICAAVVHKSAAAADSTWISLLRPADAPVPYILKRADAIGNIKT